MTLSTRIMKLESVGGRKGPVSERELAVARALLERHCMAWMYEGDPQEMALMKIAEASGEIEAARNTERRYLRSRGVDLERRAREWEEEKPRILQEIHELYGEPPTANAEVSA
jgi:hypothetical protein